MDPGQREKRGTEAAGKPAAAERGEAAGSLAERLLAEPYPAAGGTEAAGTPAVAERVEAAASLAERLLAEPYPAAGGYGPEDEEVTLRKVLEDKASSRLFRIIKRSAELLFDRASAGTNRAPLLAEGPPDELGDLLSRESTDHLHLISVLSLDILRERSFL